MNKFHRLQIKKNISLTTESVVISFDTIHNESFNFISGQYVTIKHEIDGKTQGVRVWRYV